MRERERERDGIICLVRPHGVLTHIATLSPVLFSSAEGVTTCPSACTAAMRGDDQCDDVCNSFACTFDGGDCAPIIGDPCAQYSGQTCGDCLSNPLTDCGWCSSTSKCVGMSMAEEAVTNACPAGASSWLVTTCQASETPLTVTAPASGSALKAGNSYSISWTGGPSGGRVTIRYWVQEQDSVYGGFGIPQASVLNNGQFTWAVEGGILTSSKYVHHPAACVFRFEKRVHHPALGFGKRVLPFSHSDTE